MLKKTYLIIALIILAALSYFIFFNKEKKSNINIKLEESIKKDIVKIESLIPYLKIMQREVNMEIKNIDDNLNTFDNISKMSAEDLICYDEEKQEINKKFISLLKLTKENLMIAEQYLTSVKNNNNDLDITKIKYESKDFKLFINNIDIMKSGKMDFTKPFVKLKEKIRLKEKCADQPSKTI